ncbi:MAG: radical SAM protein [Desulfobacteraceae bacterium]|nr:MAG: radical SAM protein [Desulfobacteraceae bacterium]
MIRHLNPLSLTVTGGEPLLRQDLENIVSSIRRQTEFVFINLITNGWLLSVDRAKSLWDAGLNQITVSLDFPDARHDCLRGKDGLWRRLSELLPKLSRSGIDNLCLNTVIMKENSNDLLTLARLARDWHFKISFSTYNPFKIGNPDHLIPPEQTASLSATIEELIRWKRKHRNVTNSDDYLRKIPRYFERGRIPGCLAGRKWVQICPDGVLKRCSDSESLGDWSRFRPNRLPHTLCQNCWYACRGEAEAPLGIRRILELNRPARPELRK